MSTRQKNAILLILVLGGALSAWAQLEVGDNTSLRLNGNVTFGYTGDFSNTAPSDHGFTPGGNADLSGYYYNPNFLSFDVQPFYNQSRLNSTYQSVFQSTGVGASASIFGGSNFPGSVSFNRIYNNSSGYVLPGVGSLTTSGNSQNIAVNWGIRVPDYPKVSFQFADGGNSNTIYGTSEDTTSHVNSFGVQVTDRLAGFDLSSGFMRTKQNELIPQLITGSAPETSDSTVNSFNAGAGHKLPLDGAFSVNYNRSDLSTEYTGGSYNGTIDTISSNAGFAPIRRLNVSVSTQYTDNLTGELYQPVVAAGGVVPSSLLNYSTNAFSVTGQASYSLSSFNFIVSASHQDQTVMGESISANVYQEMVNFGRAVGGGFLNATVGVSQSALTYTNDPTTLGTFAIVAYTRKVQGWELSGSGNYTRNTQTVLLAYTSSGEGYTASVGRRIGARGHWNLSASDVKNSFNNIPGSGNSSQNYSGSISIKMCGVNAGYSKASGNSFLTPTGLTPSPIPIPGTASILFNGSSYSGGAFATPVRNLMLSATFARARSDTFGNVTGSRTATDQFIALMQYRLRKIWIQGGYLKLNQGLSVTGQPPAIDSSFYMGISRWFNFF